MDIEQQEVDLVISDAAQEEQQSVAARQESEKSSLASFYLDAVVDLEKAIKMAQQRVWKALKVEPTFDLSTEEAHNVLTKLAKSKAKFVILNIDLVGSTRLSMTLPVDRLAALVQSAPAHRKGRRKAVGTVEECRLRHGAVARTSGLGSGHGRSASGGRLSPGFSHGGSRRKV